MLISIIIPTFNSGKTIKRCIDSIVEQTFHDWELLVMDGVSTDDTLTVVRPYNDPRIRMYSEPDKGIYDAMNKGILEARGEWLYFLGSDDYLHDETVLEDVATHLSKEYKVVYGEVEAPQLGERHRGEWSINDIDYNRCHQAIFYHRSVFKKYGLYNLNYSLYADHDLNIKWLLDSHARTKYVDRLIANYSNGGASATKQDIGYIRDYEWNVLKRGWGKLSREQQWIYIQRAAHLALFFNLKTRLWSLQTLKFINKMLSFSDKAKHTKQKE